MILLPLAYCCSNRQDLELFFLHTRIPLFESMLESWCDKNCDTLLIFQAIAAQPLVRQSDKSFLKAEWKPLAEIENMRTYRSESDFLLVGILIDWNLFLIFQ